MDGKRTGVTASELIERLAVDAHHQETRRVRDQELSRIADARRQEQQQLLSDLASAGAVVRWVGQLLQILAPDERIYPVLLNHITKPYSPWLLEWIGRSFGNKSARTIVWSDIVALIKNHKLEQSAVNGLFYSISAIAKPGDLSTLIDLFDDPSLGSGRIYLVRNLMRSKRQEARFALVRNQADPDLTLEIITRLSRQRV